MPKAPHEKTFEEMDFTETLNYWAGYVLMELGAGHTLRNTLNTIITSVTAIAYRRGFTDGVNVNKKNEAA